MLKLKTNEMKIKILDAETKAKAAENFMITNGILNKRIHKFFLNN